MLNKLLVALMLFTAYTSTSFASGIEESFTSPGQLIKQTVEKLNPIVEQGHSYYQEDPERLYGKVGELLETFFDFDAFAKGVMGRYFSSASSLQKVNFSTVLKRSLVHTFTDGLVSLGPYSVIVLPSAIPKLESKKAKVTMQLSSKNAQHELTYSLSRSSKNNLWRVRNLVFDGVNIGLIFRSQFNNEVLNRAGNIEDVINNWEINIDQ